MGVWSEHCIAMTDIFRSLASEHAEEFIFATVDIDEQQELRKQYNIQHVPTLLVFKNAQVVRTEEGLLQPREARDLLKEFDIYHESDLLREQARDKHISGDTQSAILLLTDAIKKDPSNTRIAMDMVQIFIDIRQIDQANSLFNRLDEKSKQSDTGKSLALQLFFIEQANKTAGRDQLEQQRIAEPDNNNVRFDLAVCMIADYQFSEAADVLFEIIKTEPEFREGAARELISTISNLLTDRHPELAQQIRKQLSNLLSA